MSIRLEMLQVARLAPRVLEEEATRLVEGFLRRQQNEDGGFPDRTGKSDLYYTVFGLEGLMALAVDEPDIHERAESYVLSFKAGERLDFVHLCCLVRAWATLQHHSGEPHPHRAALLDRLAVFVPVLETAYGAFLRLAAYQDLRAEIPDPLRVVQNLKLLETPDGAWANDRVVKRAATNSTAAALAVLRNLAMPVNAAVVSDWLMAQAHPQGGFLALPGAPIPDLLSTATALHALAGLQRDFSSIKESCLDFIDSLWTNAGGFHGHWQEDVLDTEYTYYGLLALGHLSY